MASRIAHLRQAMAFARSAAKLSIDASEAVRKAQYFEDVQMELHDIGKQLGNLARELEDEADSQ